MNSIDAFTKFLEHAGALHDAVIERITWSPADQRLELFLSDIYATFEGLPEYPGAMPATIALIGVVNVRVELSMKELRLNIHDFSVEESTAQTGRAKIVFWPSGRLEFDFSDAEWPAFSLKRNNEKR